METELKTKENELHDEEFWAQIIDELILEDEEDIETLLDGMII